MLTPHVSQLLEEVAPIHAPHNPLSIKMPAAATEAAQALRAV
jgi:hypothetical protein